MSITFKSLALSAILSSFAFSASADVEKTAFITAGQEALPPIGWIQFCQDEAQDCNVPTLPAKNVELTEEKWKKILQINNTVNREVTAVSDQEHFGAPELWAYPTDGKGDCEDYALEKRRRLIEAGFPRQSVLITVVRDKRNDGHAVLMVKTDRGDFILDNQVGKVLLWTETGLKFNKRQSQENPNRWVSLGGIDTKYVASQK